MCYVKFSYAQKKIINFIFFNFFKKNFLTPIYGCCLYEGFKLGSLVDTQILTYY